MCFPHRNGSTDSLLKLNGRKIPFVNSVKFLGVNFDKRMTWRIHIQTIEANSFRIFIKLYCLFKSEQIGANIKLTPHKALIRSIMTHACNAWEFAAEMRLLKLECLQNKVLNTIGNFLRVTSVRDMHVAFCVLYVYDYITLWVPKPKRTGRLNVGHNVT
jgi:hypothetical protein